MAEPVSLSSRIRGSFVGLAVCDALGGPVEFKKRGTFAQVTSMLPNKKFGLGPGFFTDDTSMALCLAHSLLHGHGEAKVVDQVQRYIDWWQKGYMSSTDACFDIGVTTQLALQQWSRELEARDSHLQPDSRDGDEALGSIEKKIIDRFSGEKFCGNGSLMRVLPVALIARSEPEALRLARQSSLPTHPHRRCVHACMLYAALVYQTLNGASKTALAISLRESLSDESVGNINGPDQPLDPVLKQRLERYQTLGDWETTASDQIRSTGYVVDTLEASLWAFFKTNSFEDGAILAVNLGDDADTVGAIYGGIAAAYYGVDAIPEPWRRDLQRTDLLDEVVEKILTYRAKSA